MRLTVTLSMTVCLGLAAAGCDSNDSTTDPGPVTPTAPTLMAEPEFTPGASNGVRWSDKSSDAADDYLAERATDAGFTSEVVGSGWITATFFEFTGLQDGVTYYYRVKARTGTTESDYANPVFSTQDASTPTSNPLGLAAEQTSMTFEVAYAASDAISGVDRVELWSQRDGGGFSLYGTFLGSPIVFAAPEAGLYDFFTLAIDRVGNREAKPEAGEVGTEVPSLIILTDQTGKEWDITHAVMNYGMAAENWRFGLGPNAIPPVIDPQMLSPGDPAFPGSDQIFIVLGVEAGGEARAYPLLALLDNEVVDDTIGGVPLAVTF